MNGREISLSLGGRSVRVPEGSTILEAARSAGLSLPTLCEEDRLPPEEACRLCLVEVAGRERPVAACATRVEPGMEVILHSERLAAERRAVLELVLNEHYGDCLAPCTQRCPAGIDIQGYIALIARGQYLEAARLIRRRNPLPMTCGRVCPHPCESVCRRGRVDQPVNINHLKRFCCDIAYQDLDKLNPTPAPPTGKRVAIVGGGPAGLTAAYYLALMGHAPTIFESHPRLGGMLRYGIPAYRLPKEVLDREIEAILRLGVQVRTSRAWGRDFRLTDLTAQGFQAVFLGIGAAVNRRLDFLPQDMPGVNYGTRFLEQVANGQETGLHGRVAVIGGGNTAMDCARTAVRLGASEVTVFYRRSRKEMPAQDIEVEEAQEEGVRFEFCVAPVAARTEDGRLSALEMVRMDLCEVDASGRARPKPIPGSEFVVPLDYVVVAVGQVVDRQTLQQDPLAATLALSRRGTVKGDYQTGLTNLEGVFAGGDLTTGPATVIEAIGAARRAAEAMDRWLRGRDPRPRRRLVFSKGTLSEVAEVNFRGRPRAPRATMPTRPAAERRRDFGPVELGLDQEQARAESLRCLACGCQARHDCLLRRTAEDLGLRDLVVQKRAPASWRIRRDHPHLLVENSKCVVCRRCQRACEYYHGRSAIRVELAPVEAAGEFRGHHIVIDQHCDSCGLCAAVCPTGALSPKPPWPQPGPFPLQWHQAVCDLCALGCSLKVGHIGEHLVQVEGDSRPPAWGHLCRRGRFDLTAARHDPERILRPRLRGTDLDWESALDTAARELGAIRDTYGGQALAGLCLGRGTLEEFYLLGKLVRLGLMSNHLDFMAPQEEDPVAGALLADLAGGVAGFRYQEVEDCALLVVIGSGLSRLVPLLDSAVHRMIARGGRLILLGRDRELYPRAHLHRDLPPPQAMAWTRALLTEGQGPEEARALLPSRGQRLVLVAESALDPDSRPLFQDLLEGLVPRGTGVALVPMLPAVLALRRAGISPDHYPGHRPLSETTRRIMEATAERALPRTPGLAACEILRAAAEGSIQGLVILAGHNPPWELPSASLLTALQGAGFSLVMATHPSPLVAKASLVLPGLLGLEKNGTFMDAAGRRREVAAALPPPEGVPETWRLLARLLEALGGPPAPPELVAVQSEMVVLDQEFARGEV